MIRALRMMCVGVALAVAAAGVGKMSAQAADDASGSAEKAKQRAPMRGPMPAFYKQVVDAEQRDAIYKIHDRYDEQLEPLQKQIKEIEAQRDAEMEAVLRPEQKEKIAQLKEEAAKTKEAKKSAKSPAKAKSSEPAHTDTAGKP